MNIKLLVMNIGLILSGMFAGLLSSVFWFPLSGIILGGFLSLAVVLTNLHHAKSLHANQKPGWGGVLVYAMLVGVVASACIMKYYVQQSSHLSPHALVRISPSTGAFAFLYAIGILPVYHARWTKVGNYWFLVLFLMTVIFSVLGCILLFGLSGRSWTPDIVEAIMRNCMAAIALKSMPFVLLWTAATCMFDPAYSLGRWKEITG